MPYPETLALLREALDLLNDRPNFGLRRDPHQTSYKLALRIEAHIAGFEAQATHPAIDIARRLWSDDHHIQVDQGEQEISEGQDGIWVRAWLLVEADDLPDDEPDPPAAAGGEEAIKRAVTGNAVSVPPVRSTAEAGENLGHIQ
jgi:hypothetical protein